MTRTDMKGPLRNLGGGSLPSSVQRWNSSEPTRTAAGFGITRESVPIGPDRQDERCAGQAMPTHQLFVSIGY